MNRNFLDEQDFFESIFNTNNEKELVETLAEKELHFLKFDELIKLPPANRSNYVKKMKENGYLQCDNCLDWMDMDEVYTNSDGYLCELCNN